MLSIPYILGLWAGDGYWRSSSIGLTNKNISLIKVFYNFLRKKFERERIKLSVYSRRINRQEISKFLAIPPQNIKFYLPSKKQKNDIFIIYVNSRGLLREFQEMKDNLTKYIVSFEDLLQYLAGRFDADGHYDRKKNRLRIAYTTKKEAENDSKLIQLFLKMKPPVKFYQEANEWILELQGKNWLSFINDILGFSRRAGLLQCHRQLVP